MENNIAIVGGLGKLTPVMNLQKRKRTPMITELSEQKSYSVTLLKPTKKTVAIRPITIDDAQAFTTLRQQLACETDYLFYAPDEIDSTHGGQQKTILSLCANPRSALFVIDDITKLIGFIATTVSPLKKYRHTANIAIGILQQYTKIGLGRALFDAVDHWRLHRNIYRYELIVSKNNHIAINLYKKLGFTIEGTKQLSRLENNKFCDELIMAKLFEPAN